MSGRDRRPGDGDHEPVPGNRRGAPLEGVRVLDLTRNLAGPFCTMILGDLGADVVKVEQPGRGDDTRAWMPPSWAGVAPTFLAANRNKRSVAIDFDHPDGRGVLKALAARSDVLVESFRPGSLDRRGLGYHELAERNHRLVYCSISAYGDQGPMRDAPGYDPVLQAYTGIMSLTGEADGPPVRVAIGAIDLGSGLWAALGVQLALAERGVTGRGSHVQTSLFETATWWLSYQMANYLGSGEVPHRQGSGVPMIAPYEAFVTADGDLFVAGANDGLFGRLATAMDLEELPADPRFATNPDRVRHRGELRAILQRRFLDRTAADWEACLREHSVPCSRIRTIADLAVDPQLEALGMLTPFAHRAVEGLRLVDLPLRQGGRRARRHGAPPALGEHTDEILAEVGYAPEAIAALRSSGAVG